MDAIKLIAFDWDQTLWNSWDVHVMAAHYAARVLGLPAPSEKWIASSFSTPFPRHMAALFPENTEEAIKQYLEFYHSKVKELGGLFEGVPEMMAGLKDRGYLLALLSDKREVYGTSELEAAGIAKLLNYVLFLDGDRAYKPDPEGLRQVIDALSVSRGQALYVGDSPVDIQCARRAGVASAAALWGSIDEDGALREGPDYVWHKVTQVLIALRPERVVL